MGRVSPLPQPLGAHFVGGGTGVDQHPLPSQRQFEAQRIGVCVARQMIRPDLADIGDHHRRADLQAHVARTGKRLDIRQGPRVAGSAQGRRVLGQGSERARDVKGCIVEE